MSCGQNPEGLATEREQIPQIQEQIFIVTLSQRAGTQGFKLISCVVVVVLVLFVFFLSESLAVGVEVAAQFALVLALFAGTASGHLLGLIFQIVISHKSRFILQSYKLVIICYRLRQKLFYYPNTDFYGVKEISHG